MVFGRTLWKSLLLPCFCLRLPFLFFSPKCTIETSARLFSEQKLMTLILNIAFNTQIKSNQIKQCDHTWGKLAIDHALSDKMTTASSSKSNFYFKQEISLINWNVSCPKLRQCKKSCFFFFCWNIMSLIWCLSAVTRRLCDWLRLTELLWCSEWVWPSRQLSSHWRPTTHAYISELPPPAAYPYHNAINPPPLACLCHIDLCCHMIKEPHIFLRKPLNVADCLCTRITCIVWIFCPALNETIIPVCLLKPQLKSLFEIPSILLFASPSCQRFMQFICRSAL